MPNDASNTGFQSVLAPLMDKFLQEKHACGYAYHEPTRILRRLDDFLVQEGLAADELPRSVARKWLAKKAHESARTQQQRITLVRHFSRFLLRAGYPAYVPDSTLAARNPSTFVPRMLTGEELRKFFHALDALEPTARSPYAPFTHCFVNCCCSVEFLTRDEARDPGSMIIDTCSLFIPCDGGIERARISTPNFLFWPPTWGISIFPELSVTFISPPNCFPRSQHE